MAEELGAPTAPDTPASPASPTSPVPAPGGLSSAAPANPNMGTVLGSPPSAPTTVPDWRGAVDPSLRFDPALVDIKDINSLAKGYISAQQLVGKSKVVIPDSKSTPSQWGEFYKTLGCPETPQGYSYTEKAYANAGPQGEKLGKDDADWVKQVSHELGFSDRQSKGLYEKFHERYQTLITGAEETKQGMKKQWLDDLRSTWKGTDYDVNIQAAGIGVRALGGDELAQVLEDSGLGDHPALVKSYARLGHMLREDRALAGKAAEGGFVASAQEARAEIGRLNGDPAFLKAYTNDREPGHKAAVEKMERLFRSGYPS